jgi:hypothetical protein
MSFWQADSGEELDPFALGSLMAGILSLFCLWTLTICALPVPIVGIVMGILGLRGSSRTLAIIGIALNALGMVVICLIGGLAIAFVASHPELTR